MVKSFYSRDTVEVANDLIGCIVESKLGGVRTTGRIVEVESYIGPDDPAAHGYGNRKTQRNSALFGPPGTSYVYFIYGMHWCFNAVTEGEGYPSAVLIRALEPLTGLEAMKRRRATTDETRLCSGPARLCQALGIDGSRNGKSLQLGPVRILPPDEPRACAIYAGPRIGISRAVDWPLRFAERASPWLSRSAE